LRRPVDERISLDIAIERWPLKKAFRITGYTFVEFEVLVVILRQNEWAGRGEAAGVYYRNDTPGRMAKQVEAVRPTVESGRLDRTALHSLLPRGGARNALDCALWDLEARRKGSAVWQLAGLAAPMPLLTTFTLGADDPIAMAAGARAFAQAGALKLKLTGDELDGERVRAVRAARPDVWLGVDANQGCSLPSLQRLMPALVEANVAMIEQPLPIGQEAQLDGIESPIPIAADESVQGLEDIAGLCGRFSVVNIKLDKCGGLSEALAMVCEARRLGLQVMVGSMPGTALAMAPAFLLGQLCDFVDLDAPVALASDRSPGAVYDRGLLWCSQEIWGAAGTPQTFNTKF
jgi:L-alanine-DL-glutamate epimerase-like enolase superfamily enzyme